ncbi:MAG TPA: hypothetical protein VKR58_12835, partial [Aquella sp.]|nr:hypothetical protein [Aquella sp.]
MSWTGPHGMLVSIKVNSVVAEDGFNILYQIGAKSQFECKEPEPTEAEYKAKYTRLDANGSYYWKMDKDYWVGP